MPHCRYCNQDTGFVTYCPSHFHHEELCKNAKELFTEKAKKKILEKKENTSQKELEERVKVIEEKVNKLEISNEIIGTSVRKVTRELDKVKSVMEVSLIKQLQYLPGYMGTPAICYLESLGSWHIKTWKEAAEIFNSVQSHYGATIDTYSAEKAKRAQSCIFLQDVLRVLLQKTIDRETKDALIDLLFEIEIDRLSTTV
jgi:hypothetical protein